MLYGLILFIMALSLYLIITSLLSFRKPAHSPLDELIAENPFKEQLSYSLLESKEKYNKLNPRNILAIIKNFYDNLYFRRLKNQAEGLRLSLNYKKLMSMRIAFLFISCVLVYLLLPNSRVIAMLIIIPPSFLVWDIFILYRIKAKKEAILRVLPETIDLLDMCISAGADFISSIGWLTRKAESNAFVEQLAIVLSEIKVGKTHAEALRDMEKRLQIPDVTGFVRTIVQSERMGTPIEETFKNLSADIRSMRLEIGERYAIKASVKILFPLIFCILPTIMIVVAGPILIQFLRGGFFE